MFSVESSGDRIDRWLTHKPDISSRSRALELIQLGLVRVNGKKAKASYKVKCGDQIEIEFPLEQPSELQPLNFALDILFEDEDLLVLNKPSGLVVHPALGHRQDTLVNALLGHLGKLGVGFHADRPGIVHRLDRDTSGILVVAKSDLALHGLAAQFQAKTTHRIYWALVHGQLRFQTGTWKSYLARDPRNRKRFSSSSTGKGKLAITHYRVLQELPQGFSWIECRLETGRTHQIRVHTSESSHPILADPVYSRKNLMNCPRLALHACELGFTHPRNQNEMKFKVDWPQELAEFCKSKGVCSD